MNRTKARDVESARQLLQQIICDGMAGPLPKAKIDTLGSFLRDNNMSLAEFGMTLKDCRQHGGEQGRQGFFANRAARGGGKRVS